VGKGTAFARGFPDAESPAPAASGLRRFEFDFDKALDWLQKGAQPSDTCRSLLSEKGVMIKKHLLEGVKKGAFTADVAEQKFQTWLKDKEAKLQADKDKSAKEKEADKKQRLEAEAKVKEAKAQAIAKKLADEAAAAKKTEAVEEAPAENTEAPAAE
jgi:small subunit ribosomal protein S16